MNILDKWLKDLSVDNSYKNVFSEQKSYICTGIDDNEMSFADFCIDINNIEVDEQKRAKINTTQGLFEERAKEILRQIFNKESMYPVEVYLCEKNLYNLKHGFHRFKISQFLNFQYIPIKIVKKSNRDSN